MTKDSQETSKTAETETPPLRMVGIAASAGGLEAVSLLVQNLEASVHASYVIAQHMSPTHKSLLTSLISRGTKLPVIELQESVIPEATTIYVTPPNSDVIMKDGALTLVEPFGHPATPKPSADRLFQSLAAECGENSVGIVLSGTGSDGSYGVQAIREAGGITIAQEVDSAKYDGMPSSAIATGCIDLSLTPERIGQQFERILLQPRNFDDLKSITQSPTRLSDLLQILLARTGVDFRGYKENTVNRRIARRMNALSIDSYTDYVDHCRTSQAEVDALYKDLLISVTRFFRDPRQFDQLKAQIEALTESDGKRQLRVWVAGCATGEEAYSIAILFAEALGGPKALKKSQLQIFATDIDERALDVARRGVYPISAAQDIPTHLLARYFDITGNELRVARELRDVTLFSRHNIFQDPPFINLDLVSIRNLLIYFEAPLQERVLYRIHYALAPDGMLFFGTSESVGAMEAHFEVRAGAEKIFSKRRSSRVTNYRYPDLSSTSRRPKFAETADAGVRLERDKSADAMFDSLVKAVAPNGFMATKNGDILRIIGDISPYIEISEHNPLAMTTRLLRKTLRDEVISLMAISLKSNRQRSSRWHEFQQADSNRVRFQCFPISGASGAQDNCLIAIHTKTEDARVMESAKLDGADRAYIERMEADMRSTQDALQQTVEELQTTNEELQSVNEEMQSTNEELQATNEELETSNEEMQSANEELITVNEELQINSAELQAVLADLDAILKDSPFIILAVDPALMVRRASDLARKFFSIDEIPSTGLHLSQLAIPEGFPNLSRPSAEVLNHRQTQEIMIDTLSDNYRLSLAPYSNAKSDLSGLTISVFDREIASVKEVAQLINNITGLSHWRYDIQADTFSWASGPTPLQGMPAPKELPSTLEDIYEIFAPEDQEHLRAAFADAIAFGTSFSVEAQVIWAGDTSRAVCAKGAVLKGGQGEPAYILGTISDTVEQASSPMRLSASAQA
ncbi:CheR family methyltransferase [Pseudooceanicola spongiae]|uniref:CheR family methyltransferase n=1 Tax=Pseudooceanicola spongiae TaxID=2613965 RepID=UPI0018691B3C|nr:CheR family methyltransferase [Pseudooceanicola spongiae]